MNKIDDKRKGHITYEKKASEESIKTKKINRNMARLSQILLVIVLSFPLHVSAQQQGYKKNSDLMVYGYLVKEGTINPFIDNIGSYRHPASMLYIQSRSSEVFSVSKGKVINIFTIDNSMAITIKRGGSYFVYASLEAVNFKVGDKIKKGDELGQIKKQQDGNYELIFTMSEKDRLFDYFELVAYLKGLSKK